jgi:cell wall-associated NlpC family hydrolase
VFVVTLAACLLAVPAFAAPPSSLSSKRAEAAQVVHEINGLNASLSRADELLNLANLKLQHVRSDIKENKRELRIAKLNLAKSRQTIARRLVTLYTSGVSETSTLELILGAKSLDDILNQLDTENRVSSVDAQVIGQVQVFKASIKVHARKLAVAKREVGHLVAMRRAQEHAIEVRLGERRRLLSSLNSDIAELVREQQAAAVISAQQARARAAEAQGAQAQLTAGSVVGASASTPEGATVVPPSNYGGAVGVALGQQGVPYVWGGASPGGFDCSGLVMYAYAAVGVSLPHSSYAQYNVGVAVPRDQLQPGDIVFFDGLGHEGLYIGGGMFVHAPHSGTVVQVASLNSGWYAATYVGARRIL